MRELTTLDKRLLKILGDGMPVCEEPYQWLADQVGVDKAEVYARLDWLRAHHFIKRIGFVVNHHQVGYQTNGMVVWNFEDDQVDQWGEILGNQQAVTLCYKRPRRLPEWPYNLFSMIHGTSREQVLSRLNDIIEQHQLASIPHEVLFSTRQFKQKGANLVG